MMIQTTHIKRWIWVEIRIMINYLLRFSRSSSYFCRVRVKIRVRVSSSYLCSKWIWNDLDEKKRREGARAIGIGNLCIHVCEGSVCMYVRCVRK